MHKKDARYDNLKLSMFNINVMNYFNTIQNVICDSADEEIARNRNKEKIWPILVETLDKVKEVIRYNEEEFQKNSDYIVKRISLLESMNLDSDDYLRKKRMENFKRNCWWICSSKFKNNNIKQKYPLGVLVITDLFISNEALKDYM
jgi:hypothetical protein